MQKRKCFHEAETPQPTAEMDMFSHPTGLSDWIEKQNLISLDCWLQGEVLWKKKTAWSLAHNIAIQTSFR